MKQIKPINSSRFFLVDDEDFERLSKYKWYVGGNGRCIYMSEFYHSKRLANVIMKDNKSIYDHRDVDSFNNQKDNLRKCSGSQNAANRNKRPNFTSKYKGVSWKVSNRAWIAQIKVKQKQIYIGLFLDEIEAAVAYDDAAIYYFGEFAKLNFQLYGA